MADAKYSISFSSHSETSKQLFESLLYDEEFSDIALFCDDDRVIKSHRAILSAFSPFFKNIFRNLPGPGGSIYLSGIESKSLTAILEYVYKGETFVQESDLELFIKSAEKLQVHGIYPVGNFQQKKISSLSRTNYNDVFMENVGAENCVEIDFKIKIEPEVLLKQEDESTVRASENGEQVAEDSNEYTENNHNVLNVKEEHASNEVELMMTDLIAQNCLSNNPSLGISGLNKQNIISCEYCQFKTRKSFLLRTHIQRLHSKSSAVRNQVSCMYCGKYFDSQETLNNHKTLVHNVVKA